MGADARAGYTLGLLHSVGRLLLERLALGNFAPLSGRKATAAAVLAWERDSFGFDSGVAARRLFTLWNFAPELGLALENCFSPQAAPHDRWAALLHLASWVAEKIGYGLAVEKECWTAGADILAQAGASKELVDNCAEESAVDLAKLCKMVG